MGLQGWQPGRVAHDLVSNAEPLTNQLRRVNMMVPRRDWSRIGTIKNFPVHFVQISSCMLRDAELIPRIKSKCVSISTHARVPNLLQFFA
jgi:hypothetical protein